MSDAVWTEGAGETPLTPDELQGLKPSLSTRAQLNELEQENIIIARRWAMHPRVRSRPDLLTDHFARELHRRMFNGVWKWAGKYRPNDKNFGWEWHRVPEAMRVLLDDAKCWIDYKTYPLDEAAVRLHHRLVVIHPWSNGNGRHARLMADLMMAANGTPELSWGANRDLSQSGADRTAYLTALKEADRGEIGLLLKFARS